MKQESVWVIIPAHNEEKNIIKVVAEAKKHCSNIIVVDDGSKDNTYGSAKLTGVIVLRNIVNMGKGSALKTGCDYAVNQGAKILIALDADTQHDPVEIPNFLKSIKQGNEFVFGFRKFNKSMPFILKFGNQIINLVVKFLYHLDLKDTQCGYRAFTANAYDKIRWRSGDYSVESEMIANIGKHKLSYAEIPIQTIYSDNYKGTTILDGIKIVFNMFFWRLRWF